MVLLAVCTVGLAGHAASATPADQDTGEQIHCVLVGRSPGIQSLDALHQLKILTGNQRFVCIRDAHPLGGRALLHLLDLVIGGALLALHQRSGIGFILQDADDGGGRPLTVRFIGITVFRIGQAVVFLVGQRGENAQPVQLRCDLGAACALQPHTENVADHAGGIGIGDEQILVVLGFHIAVHRERADEVAVAPLHIQRGAGLDGNVPAVGFVHNVLDRYGQIIAAVVGGVDAVGDGNEAHPVGREYPAQIPAGFNVLAPQPGEVFYNDAVDVAIGDILHHFLECGTVEDDAAVSIVDLFGNDLNIRVALHKVLNELALIGNAVAFAGMIVGVGQADISGCFVFRHEKALLSPGLLPHEKSGYLAIRFSSFSTPIIALSAEKSEDVA